MLTVRKVFLLISASVCLVISGCLTNRQDTGSFRIPLPDELPPHPRYLLNQEEINQIRAEAKIDPWAAGIIEELVGSAQKWDPAKLSEIHPGVRHSSLGKPALDLALAYQFEGELTYAKQAAQILLAYADLAQTLEGSETAGLLADSTMGDSVWIIDICWAYDLIYNAPVLSYEEKKHIETDLIDRTGLISGRGCNHWSSSNWRARALVILASAGFTTGNRDLLDEALNGRYNKHFKAFQYGFAQNIGHAIRSDGTYWETSLGYTYLSMDSMALIAEVAMHSGLDLWNMKIKRLEKLPARTAQRDLSSPGASTLTDAVDALFYRAFPNMQVSLTGNSRRTEISASQNIFEGAYQQHPDPRYAWLIWRTRRDGQADSKDPQKRPADIWSLAMTPRNLPDGHFSFADDTDIGITGRHRNGCTLFPDAGYVIMRGNGDDVEATAFEMLYGRVENSHDHPDRLAVNLYGLDQILAPDAGKESYGTDNQLTWMKQTIAHNTVTVGETSQYPQEDNDTIWVDAISERPPRGDLVFFHAGNDFKAVRAVSDKVYANCMLDRTLILLDPFVIDVFSVTCDSKEQIDWAWHGYGVATSAVPGEVSTGPMSARKGYLHLTNASVETSERDWDVTWSGSNSHMRLYQLGETGTTHVLVSTPSCDNRDRTAAISRRMGTNTVFISVMEPYRNEPQLISLKSTMLDDDSIAIELEHAGGIETVILPRRPTRQVLTLDDVQVNAFALWRRESPRGCVVASDAAIAERSPAIGVK